MTNVIGCRIKNTKFLDNIQKFCMEHHLTNSELVEQALRYYLKVHNQKVLTSTETDVNKEIFENKYQELTKKIDEHLNDEEDQL